MSKRIPAQKRHPHIRPATWRRIRKQNTRAAGDHRRWYPSRRCCAVCGARYVRFYRGYGGFLRDSEIVCNVHLPRGGEWRVPLIESADGSVWGFTSCPTADFERWRRLPEAGPCLAWNTENKGNGDSWTRTEEPPCR